MARSCTEWVDVPAPRRWKRDSGGILAVIARTASPGNSGLVGFSPGDRTSYGSAILGSFHGIFGDRVFIPSYSDARFIRTLGSAVNELGR